MFLLSLNASLIDNRLKTASEPPVGLSESCIYICFAHVPGYSSLNGWTDSPLASKQDLNTSCSREFDRF